MESLKNLYYGARTGYTSVEKLYRRAHSEGLKVTRPQVQEFISKQFTAQVNQPDVRPKVYNSIISTKPRNNYQIDLMIYDRYTYQKYKYMLVVIDVFSRFLQVVPLTTRKFPVIMDKLNDVCKKIGYPKNINCDNEFNTKEFITWAKLHNITVWFSEPDEINKNAIVERVNRTIAGLLQKYRTATGDYNWPRVLPDIVHNYNTNYHTTIKNTPQAVFKGGRNKQTAVMFSPALQVGSKVRIKRVKKVFDKGDVLTYSKDAYVVSKIAGNRYVLRNSRTGEATSRAYKPQELKPFNEVQEFKDKPVSSGERTQEQNRRERATKRKLREEGVDVERAVRETRATRRVPLAQTPKPTSKRKAAAPAERVFDADDKDTYIVEKILGERKRKGGKQYQVSWEGYTERTWEPARNLPSAVLRAWRERKK